jgi:hypothetical protein
MGEGKDDPKSWQPPSRDASAPRGVRLFPAGAEQGIESRHCWSAHHDEGTIMRVIGIDVGPAKGGQVCDDGELLEPMNPANLDSYLHELSGDVLIAWDAPLTGPPDPDVWTDKSDLSTRPIESFFMRPPYKAPKGISVRPYSGCPHWTISRRLLGLPRVGRYDETELPFQLVSDDQPPRSGRHIVEVHPAVALWRWCRADGHNGPWEYKNKKYKNKKCTGCMKDLCILMSARMGKDLTGLQTDDQLDATLAWHLAESWRGRRGVRLLGNARAGSFLLPDETALWEQFKEFTAGKGRA